ncbi:hypothetical protein B0H13DRAFT_1578138, partial [Mycena leptocephala]
SETEQTKLWAPVLVKIDDALDNRNCSSPSLDGLITQMIVSGMAQYLTQVQRIP